MKTILLALALTLSGCLTFANINNDTKQQKEVATSIDGAMFVAAEVAAFTANEDADVYTYFTLGMLIWGADATSSVICEHTDWCK